MKKNFALFMVAIMAAVTMNAQNEVQPYFTVDELPDLIKCLPAPPAFDSPEFAYDMMRFAWGKQQRLDEERAAIAKRDAVCRLVKSLKAKKTYYVRIRTYKTVKGVKYLSPWSKAKTVKTK